MGAEIAFAEGDVEISRSRGVWQIVKAGTSIMQDYGVRVIGSGKAIINFDDGSALRMNSGSEIKLIYLRQTKIQIQGIQGEVYARVTPSSREFSIHSDDNIYKSLGTAYKVVAAGDNEGVEVYESQVKVTTSNSTELLVNEGEKYTNGKAVEKIDLKEVAKDEFVLWNKVKDESNTDSKSKLGILSQVATPVPTPVSTPTTTPTSSIPTPSFNTSPTSESTLKATSTLAATPKVTPEIAKIRLTASAGSEGVTLNWSVTGVNVEKGFKIVKSTEENPVYPGSDYQYLSNGDSTSYTWTIKDGKTYYFRVCQYLGERCGVYSNNAKATAPSAESTQTVSGINLSGEGGNLSWEVSGYSQLGFKIVWSKTAGPTYPTRETDRYQYLSGSDARSTTIEPISGQGNGLYYVRVCEYLGGVCGVYSNQIEVNL